MATVNDIPLDPKKPTKRFVNSMIGWIILFAMLFAAAIFLQQYSFLMVLGVIFVLMIGWQFWYENAYYRNYFYDIQPEFLNIKKGVITPKEAIFPYEKLQDVYVDQDVFDRIFGLWDVHISTATVLSGIEAHIDGVDEENSKKLRDMILAKIKDAKRKSGAS